MTVEDENYFTTYSGRRVRIAHYSGQKFFDTIYISPVYQAIACEIVTECYPNITSKEKALAVEVVATKFQEIENLIRQQTRKVKPEGLDKWFVENYSLDIDLTLKKRT